MTNTNESYIRMFVNAQPLRAKDRPAVIKAALAHYAEHQDNKKLVKFVEAEVARIWAEIRKNNPI